MPQPVVIINIMLIKSFHQFHFIHYSFIFQPLTTSCPTSTSRWVLIHTSYFLYWLELLNRCQTALFAMSTFPHSFMRIIYVPMDGIQSTVFCATKFRTATRACFCIINNLIQILMPGSLNVVHYNFKSILIVSQNIYRCCI